jgi:hypothetical protein
MSWLAGDHAEIVALQTVADPIYSKSAMRVREGSDRVDRAVDLGLSVVVVAWVASSRYNTSAARASRPTSAAGLTSPARGEHPRQADELGALVDQAGEGVDVDLSGVVVGDHDDVYSCSLRDLQVRKHVAAVLCPTGQDAITMLKRHRVERGVPGVRGVVEQGDLRRRRTQQLGQRVVDRPI